MAKTYYLVKVAEGNVENLGDYTFRLTDAPVVRVDTLLASVDVPDDMPHTKENATEIYRSLSIPVCYDLAKRGFFKSGMFATTFDDDEKDCTLLMHGHELDSPLAIIPKADFFHWE